MKKNKLIFILLFSFAVVFSGCSPIMNNILKPNEKETDNELPDGVSAVDQGSIGSVYWCYGSDSCLYFFGAGNINESEAPWSKYDVKQLSFADKIENIGTINGVTNLDKILLGRKNTLSSEFFEGKIIKEFDAIGTGGLYLSGSEKAIVVSIGTGTAFVRADKLNLKHLGGTGVGAGTLTNLCKRFAGTKDFDEILNLSKIGNLDNVDLKIGDITEEKINTLPSDLTLSNFGNLKPSASNSDIILGILNMIFETIGMMAAFSSINDDIKEIVLIGNIVTLPCVKSILKKIENLYDISFIIPNEAQYAVALGAIIKSATKGSGPFFPIL